MHLALNCTACRDRAAQAQDVHLQVLSLDQNPPICCFELLMHRENNVDSRRQDSLRTATAVESDVGVGVCDIENSLDQAFELCVSSIGTFLARVPHTHTGRQPGS